MKIKNVIALICVLCVAAPAAAATISVGDNTSAYWPDAPILETYNPLLTTGGPGGVPGADWGASIVIDRVVGQSFVVPSAVSATSMYIEVEIEAAFTPSDMTVRVREVDDVTVSGQNNPGLGTILAESVVTFNTGTAEQVYRLDFSEPLALAPRGGDLGYAFTIEAVNKTSGDPDRDYITISSHFDPDSMDVIGGKTWSLNYDAGVASHAFALVPEPMTLGLLGLGGLAALLGRRNRR